MSNTPVIPPNTPRSGDTALPAGKGDVRGNVLNVSGDLSNVRTPSRMAGEIISRGNDGESMTIRTDRGDIQVRVRGGRIPAEGTKVEVDIAPGRPPRQIVFRAAETEAPVRTERPQPSQTSEPRPNQQTPQTSSPVPDRAPVRDTAQPQTPLPTQAPRPLPAEAAPAPVPVIPPRPVEEGQPVRLLPLPAGEVVLPARPGMPAPVTESAALDALLPLIKAQAALPAQMLAQGLPEKLANELIQAFKSNTPVTTPPPPAPGMPPPLQAVTMPAATQPVQQQPLALLNMLTAMPAADAPVSFGPPLPGAMLAAQAALGAPAQPTATLPAAPGQISMMALSPAQVPALQQPAPSFFTAPFLSTKTQVDGLIGSFTPPHTASPLLDASIQSIEMPGVKMNGGVTGEQASVIRSPVPPSNAGSMNATVSGFTPQGLPVLSLFTPGMDIPADMVMQFNALNMESGMNITLLPRPGSSGGAAAPIPATLPAAMPAQAMPLFGLFDPASPWPLMQDLSANIRQLIPQGMTTLAGTTPNPGSPAQLPPAALLFIAAMRSGDISGWLSDKSVDALKKGGRTELLARLTREFAGLSRLSSEPLSTPQGEWRAMPMPLYYDGDLHKMMLWVRQDGQNQKDGDEKGGGGKTTRFIFDLALTRMGMVQLDGLFRGERIDLMIRTQKALSEGMRQMMRSKYHNAVEGAGFTGELSFQNTPDSFIKIDTRAHAPEARA